MLFTVQGDKWSRGRQMELREFVANSLSAILDGVDDAIRDAQSDRQGKISPIIAGEEDYLKVTLPIEFDLSVLCQEKSNPSDQIRIVILPFEERGETEKTSERMGGSRIRFSVPIIYGGQRIGRT